MNKAFSPEALNAAWQAILTAKKITLLGHRNPDGDAVSSCAAMERIITQLSEKEIESIFPNQPMLPILEHPKVVCYNDHTFLPDLIISCDTANYDRLYYPEAFRGIPHINIDHHISSSIEPTYNFLDGDASSTAEVIYRLITSWDASFLVKDVANALLYGLLSDTQVFHIPVSSSTLRVAADLIDRGAEFEKIKRALLCHKDPAIIKFWGKVLSNILLTKNKRVAIAMITQEDFKKFNVTPSSLIGFINFLNEIAGIDVAALIYEIEPGKTKISLRSKSVDVNTFARKFGGGGHIRAAGIFIEEPPQVVFEKLKGPLESL